MAEWKNYSDEELIEKIADEEDGVMEFLLDKYKPLVRKHANALYLIGGDTDDLIQEGMIGLFKAIRSYQSNRDASFYHFAEVCITRQMYTAVEASQRKKHAPLNSYISLYDDADAEGVILADVLMGNAEENPEYLLIDKENIKQRLEALSGNLSKMEKQVFEYMLSGLNYRQIADKMQKSPKAIDNAVQRMKSKVAGKVAGK